MVGASAPAINSPSGSGMPKQGLARRFTRSPRAAVPIPALWQSRRSAQSSRSRRRPSPSTVQTSVPSPLTPATRIPSNWSTALESFGTLATAVPPCPSSSPRGPTRRSCSQASAAATGRTAGASAPAINSRSKSGTHRPGMARRFTRSPSAAEQYLHCGNHLRQRNPSAADTNHYYQRNGLRLPVGLHRRLEFHRTGRQHWNRLERRSQRVRRNRCRFLVDRHPDRALRLLRRLRNAWLVRKAGDQLAVKVWNAQTGYGPAVYPIAASSGTNTCP